MVANHSIFGPEIECSFQLLDWKSSNITITNHSALVQLLGTWYSDVDCTSAHLIIARGRVILQIGGWLTVLNVAACNAYLSQ
jgi:hypothetical protein